MNSTITPNEKGRSKGWVSLAL